MQIWNGSHKHYCRYRADKILSTERQTDIRRDGHDVTSIPPFKLRWSGGNIIMYQYNITIGHYYPLSDGTTEASKCCNSNWRKQTVIWATYQRFIMFEKIFIMQKQWNCNKHVHFVYWGTLCRLLYTSIISSLYSWNAAQNAVRWFSNWLVIRLYFKANYVTVD